MPSAGGSYLGDFASKAKNTSDTFTAQLIVLLLGMGVVLAGLVIALTGWLWLDPAIGLVVALVIVAGMRHFAMGATTSCSTSADSESRKIDDSAWPATCAKAG